MLGRRTVPPRILGRVELGLRGVFRPRRGKAAGPEKWLDKRLGFVLYWQSQIRKDCVWHSV